jgi:hypothetical protein
VTAVTIELLYFDGCPNHDALVAHLHELLGGRDLSADIVLRHIADDDAAQSERFLGSPTVRVDGRDVEPGADRRDDYGMKCRLYATPGGLAGLPLDQWVLDALGARATGSPQAPAAKDSTCRPQSTTRSCSDC